MQRAHPVDEDLSVRFLLQITGRSSLAAALEQRFNQCWIQSAPRGLGSRGESERVTILTTDRRGRATEAGLKGFAGESTHKMVPTHGQVYVEAWQQDLHTKTNHTDNELTMHQANNGSTPPSISSRAFQKQPQIIVQTCCT